MILIHTDTIVVALSYFTRERMEDIMCSESAHTQKNYIYKSIPFTTWYNVHMLSVIYITLPIMILECKLDNATNVYY